jgi:5'-methylthioadenosine phosphorylase
MTGFKLGIIGGSGLYEIEGLKDAVWRDAVGPFGAPSDQILEGVLNGLPVVFLPRHGRGHRLPPGALNARANICALKSAGCTDILSISAVGSLREDLAPGRFVLADQYVDRTHARASSFFGPGCVAHVSMADPVCPRLSRAVALAGRAVGAEVVEGGVYLAMEGPQFSTRAESRIHQAMGCDLVGMTGMPEAKLAREAELPYAALCMVTDYDCWRADGADVEVGAILKALADNAALAKRLVGALALALAGTERAPSPIDTCLDGAVITPKAARDPELVRRLEPVAGRALRA